MAVLCYNEYKKLAEKCSLVPVHLEINADLETPVSIFMKTGGDILLESLEKGAQAGRFSIIGINRRLSLVIRGSEIERVDHNAEGDVKQVQNVVDPLDYLREVMKEYQVTDYPDLPPFWGGLIGYLGYEIAGFYENIHMYPPGECDIPDGILVIPETVVVCDSVKRTATLITVSCPSQSPEDEYRRAVERICSLVELLENSAASPEPQGDPAGELILSEPDEESFLGMVDRCREHILAGDIIQAVLSRKLTLRSSEKPFSIYRRLRRENPSPYMFFIRFNDFTLTGSSPEVMVRVQGDEVFLKPIAGTRTRGKTVKEDDNLAEELLGDPKETAEHLMLVDLGRNDIGRVAVPGSVKVTQFMTVERFSRVMHIVSSIRGRLSRGKDAFDVVAAAFPAGTLTGAPKIRAMELISELEGSRRGHYGGMVLYLGFNGNLDSCITIRSMLCKGDQITVQAGAGIVANSVPRREFQETESKAAALVDVITGIGGE